jgi:thymidylate kinase
MNEYQRIAGKFIAFEYLDGGDPFPFIQRMEEEFFPEGGLVTDREPTNGIFGSVLRTVLSNDWDKDVPWQELAFGFLADRTDHVEKNTDTGIKNVLRNGDTFVCDRYNLSTYAYQLPSREHFPWYYNISTHLVVPDLTIFLNYDVDSCVNNALRLVPSHHSQRFSLLKVKTRGNRQQIKAEALETQEKYLQAIEFLTNDVSEPHHIAKVEVQTEFGAWGEIRKLISACLSEPNRTK